MAVAAVDVAQGGLCPPDYSFNSEAFPNLKVSRGLCPPAYSFNSEVFPNLKVLTGLCPLAYSFNSEAFSDLKVSEACAREIIPSFQELFQI